MLAMMTRTHSDDANVEPNYSQGVDLCASEGVDASASEGVDPSSTDGVDPMLTKTQAKLFSIFFPNVSCRCVIWLQ